MGAIINRHWSNEKGMGLLDFLKDTIGIDPGSQHLRIIKDSEIIFNESTQISFDKTTSKVTGLGHSIRLTGNDVIIKPIDCAIADFHGFEMLLRGAMKKGLNTKSIISKSYRIYFCIPTSTTEIEKRAYRDSAEHAGAIEVHMAFQSCCAAIGLNILFEKKNFILIDFGASKIEIIVFANSLIISDGVIRFGTWRILRLLKNYFRRKHKVELTDKEVEDVLTLLNKNMASDEIKVKYTTIKVKEIQDLLDSLFNLVNDELIETIEKVSSHSDIEKVLTNGVYFTGGGSTINFLIDQINLDKRIKRNLSPNPLVDNINGLKQIMADKEKFKNYVMV